MRKAARPREIDSACTTGPGRSVVEQRRRKFGRNVRSENRGMERVCPSHSKYFSVSYVVHSPVKRSGCARLPSIKIKPQSSPINVLTIKSPAKKNTARPWAGHGREPNEGWTRVWNFRRARTFRLHRSSYIPPSNPAWGKTLENRKTIVSRPSRLFRRYATSAFRNFYLMFSVRF